MNTINKKFLISQKEINKFAEVSGGMGAIHTNSDFAKKTIFKKTLVHGLYLLALIEREVCKLTLESHFISQIELTYLKPILVDEEFHITFHEEGVQSLLVNIYKDEEKIVIGKILTKT